MLALILKLIMTHALGDFSLQTTAMAMGKSRHWEAEKNEGNRERTLFWPYWLTAHALVHGGLVWIVTGNMGLGIVEVILHWLIDFAKCESWTNIHIDQLLHLACKTGYVLFLTL